MKVDRFFIPNGLTTLTMPEWDATSTGVNLKITVRVHTPSSGIPVEDANANIIYQPEILTHTGLIKEDTITEVDDEIKTFKSHFGKDGHVWIGDSPYQRNQYARFTGFRAGKTSRDFYTNQYTARVTFEFTVFDPTAWETFT